ncbi:MAG: DUF6599 family protein [Candidatus Eisenbacteria bacterium]
MKTYGALVSLLLPALAFGAFPDLEGWTPVGEPRSYGPDNLWEEIDGAAEPILAYGFQGLEAREVESDGIGVTVAIYDMGTPLSAFGLFRAECATGMDTIPIGTAASIYAPYQALMLKDRFFVKVSPLSGTAAKFRFREVLEAIDHAIPGITDFPDELDLLPLEFREPRTEEYTPESYLGLKELGNCVWARYLDDGHRKYRVFAIASKDGGVLEEAWAKLAGSWSPRQVGVPKVLVREIPYEGPIAAAHTGKMIIGIAGLDREEILLKKLVALAAGG